ncbi:MAG: hypothetical protein MUO38_09160, partial [Anaerolineales bacterium]|nr:hypothetical protein [Anaerolineales bacterium]
MPGLLPERVVFHQGLLGAPKIEGAVEDQVQLHQGAGCLLNGAHLLEIGESLLVMVDGFQMRVQAARLVAGQEQVFHGFLPDAGLAVVASQRRGNRGNIILAEHFKSFGNLPMKYGAFGRAQLAIQVLLNQCVHKPEAHQPLASGPGFSQFLHQAVALLQLARQHVQEGSHRRSLHSLQHLHRELLSFDTGGQKQILKRRIQSPKALSDDAFHLSGKVLPIQAGRGRPTSLLILENLAPLLQIAQQLDGKQRLALRPPVKLLAEGFIQPVWFGIQEGVDKVPAGGFSGLVQINRDFAKGRLKLIQELLQRVLLSRAAQSNLFQTVSACDQDAGILQAANQMEEQAPRSGDDAETAARGQAPAEELEDAAALRRAVA